MTAVIGVAALSAYEGCSSSNPSPGAPSDAGVDSTQPDTSTVAPPDDAQADGEPESDSDVPDVAVPSDCEDAGSGLPLELRCTGLYSDWSAKTLANNVRPYTPGYQLWSDGAVKARFIALPAGTQIDTSDMDEWVFPVGTKIWKEFRLGTKRIETRLFLKVAMASASDTGWQWTTYRWSDDQSTATKLETGEQNVDGTTYEVPSHLQCQQCHGGRKDMVLGFDAINLGASGAVGVTLASLAAQGWLTAPPADTIVVPDDGSGAARPAMGWLHSNCGIPCHNANDRALAHGTGLFLRIGAKQIAAGGATVQDLDTYKTAVNVVPHMSKYADQGYMRIASDNVDKSLIPLLDSARNDPQVPEQMPPIVSHMVDTNGVGLVKAWITSMPAVDAGAPADAGDGG